MKSEVGNVRHALSGISKPGLYIACLALPALAIAADDDLPSSPWSYGVDGAAGQPSRNASHQPVSVATMRSSIDFGPTAYHAQTNTSAALGFPDSRVTQERRIRKPDT